MFTCCHPALTLEARVALTLRTLAGLTHGGDRAGVPGPGADDGAAPGPGEAKIRTPESRTGCHPPICCRTAARRARGAVPAVQRGLPATTGTSVVRASLCDEAIRLAGSLTELMPDEPEACGLFALMLLQHSRRDARIGADGMTCHSRGAGPDPLGPGRDRARVWRRWIVPPGGDRQGPPTAGRDRRLPCEGAHRGRHRLGADRRAVRPAGGLSPQPDRRAEPGRRGRDDKGPQAGLDLVDELDSAGRLAGYHLVPATRADLLRRLGRHAEAAQAYRRALDLATSDADRRFLTRPAGGLQR